MAHFTQSYAQVYDWLYGEKDYQKEVDLIRSTAEAHLTGARKFIDYGCGTGNHSRYLAGLEYAVSGIDVNRDMLAIAKKKLEGKSNVSFFHVSEREAILSESHDVCLCLFDVLSYMNRNEDVDDFLEFARRSLVPGGLLMFDFWYGPGVMHLGPENRWKEYLKDGFKILRLTSPVMDSLNCVVHVKHKVIVLEREKEVRSFEETHNMRYFFLPEVRSFLDHHGFEIIKSGTWEKPGVNPTANDWSVLVVARRKQ